MFNRRKPEDHWEFSDLAQYNAEVGRGIVHTAEYDARMAEKQRRYAEWLRSEYPDNVVIAGWDR